MNKFLSNSKKDFIYILILTLPIFAVLSILVFEIVLIIISITFLIKVFKSKKFYYFNNFFFKFISIFYLYIVTNFLIQIESIDTLSIIFYFRYSIYVLAIYFFLDNKENLFYDFLKVISVVIVFLGLDVIIQSIFHYNIIGMEIIEKNRGSSFFGDELILGSYVFRLLPFIFMLCVLDSKIFNNKIKFPLIFISFLIVFLSGERTSMLLSIFLLIIYFIFLREDKIIKYLKIISFFLFVAISITLIFSKDYRYRYISEPLKDLSNKDIVTQNLLEGYNHEPKIIYFSGLHHNLMITSLRIFNENKFFGSGPRSYRNSCKDYQINKYSCDRHPHNFYLQLLAETGIVGLSLLIFLYMTIVKEVIIIYKKKEKNYKIKICILAFYIAALWPIIPSGNIFNNWLSIMIFLPASFYLFLSKKIN
jgi:O-antigen ligase